jgi:hypothetical protein
VITYLYQVQAVIQRAKVASIDRRKEKVKLGVSKKSVQIVERLTAHQKELDRESEGKKVRLQ